MRKYLILIILLSCLHVATRGQTVPEVDLTGLPRPTQAKALRYWFDDDGGSVKTVSSTNGIYTLDVSTLTEGLHTVHYQVIGSDGKANFIASSIFMKMKSSEEALAASQLYYWYDDETAIKQVNVSQSVQALDASMLNVGLHTLHYQVLCSNGDLTPVISSVFMRVTFDSSTTTAKSLRYWFDDEKTATEAAITDGVQLLDASKMREGLHTVHYQIVDSKGNLGAPVSSIFMKMDNQSSLEAKSIRYWFDDNHASLKVTNVANGTQNIDVTDLLTGLHTLHYQLVDDQGNVGTPVSCIFMKDFDKVVPDGQNRITQYQYWLNKNSSAMNTVDLSNASNPYQLISLIPVQKEPINSQLFHFEITDGQPVVYAKNLFNIRFHDAKGYFTDEHHAFIDYSVKQEVEPVDELQTTQTFPRVSENDIRWYTMQVAPGDTTAFRLSQAATLQVFAPSGKEVFKTSESASVQWGGIHTWEDGTYYVAVHDVTGSQSNMTLDYLHMDKYDVVDWDVHTVGNGGCSTITFKGNGFRDLYAVDLYTADGDSIHSVDISHDSDAETAVTFDFRGAELGVYDVVFHFTQEDKHFTNIVAVEEARDIELATTVTYPSTFLRGTSTKYIVKITNNGNMTAYKVPVFVYIKSSTEDGVYGLKFRGLDLQTLSEVIDTEGISIADKSIIQDFSDSFGDDWHFIRTKVEDENNPGDSIVVRSNYFFVDVSPNDTKTLELTLFTLENEAYVYFTTPKEWIVLSGKESAKSRVIGGKFYSNNNSNFYCCIKEGVECQADMLNSRLDIGSVVLSAISLVQPELAPVAAGVSWADCGVSIANNVLKAYGDFACNPNEESVKKKLQSIAGKNKQSAIGATLSCVSAKLKGLKGVITGGAAATVSNIDFGNILKSIAQNISRMTTIGTIIENISCIRKFTKPKPGCPPNPGGGGGSSNPIPPSDPNDIYGYLSDSGSKFMTDEVAKVNYTIEFENDTAFAQASAHTIVIRDTLDSRYFDLKSFLPTSVKIGERETFLDETEDVKTVNGVTRFLKTIDMRPEINAIAQVEGEYSQQTGIAKWTFSSLDPMTMESTDDLMQGILPVNYNGTSGIGEVMFEVGVKPNKGDGTQIPNRASIVFDYEASILTPTWVNIVDATAPESHVMDVQMLNDSTATVSISASDELSGPWRYDVYVQYGSGAWFKAAENVPADTMASVKIYDGIDHGFYVVVTDSAGNVEQKEAAREFTLIVGDAQVTLGDANNDGKVDAADIVAVISYIEDKSVNGFVFEQADYNGDGKITIADAEGIANKILSKYQNSSPSQSRGPE